MADETVNTQPTDPAPEGDKIAEKGPEVPAGVSSGANGIEPAEQPAADELEDDELEADEEDDEEEPEGEPEAEVSEQDKAAKNEENLRVIRQSHERLKAVEPLVTAIEDDKPNGEAIMRGVLQASRSAAEEVAGYVLDTWGGQFDVQRYGTTGETITKALEFYKEHAGETAPVVPVLDAADAEELDYFLSDANPEMLAKVKAAFAIVQQQTEAAKTEEKPEPKPEEKKPDAEPAADPGMEYTGKILAGVTGVLQKLQIEESHPKFGAIKACINQAFLDDEKFQADLELARKQFAQGDALQAARKEVDLRKRARIITRAAIKPVLESGPAAAAARAGAPGGPAPEVPGGSAVTVVPQELSDLEIAKLPEHERHKYLAARVTQRRIQREGATRR